MPADAPFPTERVLLVALTAIALLATALVELGLVLDPATLLPLAETTWN